MKKQISAALIAKIGMMSALSVVLYTFLRFPIFPPPFNALELDFSSVPALIGGFMFGPLAGAVIEVIKSLLKIMFNGSSFMLVGDLSNLIISLSFVLTATLIYQKSKTLKNAILGMAVAVCVSTLTACLSNYFIIVPLVAKIPGMGFYMEIRGVFAFGVGLGFNLLKGILNAALTFFLYKTTSRILKKGRM